MATISLGHGLRPFHIYAIMDVPARNEGRLHCASLSLKTDRDSYQTTLYQRHPSPDQISDFASNALSSKSSRYSQTTKGGNKVPRVQEERRRQHQLGAVRQSEARGSAVFVCVLSQAPRRTARRRRPTQSAHIRPRNAARRSQGGE